MDTGNIMLAILKNIPPQTVALLILVLFFSVLSRLLPRKPRNNPHYKPQSRETPSHCETLARESYKKPKKPQLSREERLGRLGETWIADILHKTVPGKFQVFRNVYVPNWDKNSPIQFLEIDLLMIHEKGIFVFESKNYSGWIFGSIGDLNWTQMFPNRKKHSFYNPVRQNQNHIESLSQYLNIPARNFYSYVVFSNYCELNKVPENTRSIVITQTADLERRLKQTLYALSPCYSEEEIQRISERVALLTNVDKEIKEQHIADIRAAQESEVCPWCGNALVLREGRYGVFWGCASYPRCRFTRKAG